VSIEERILNIAEAPNWYDGRELRAIALEVRKMEDRIKQLEEMYEGEIGENPDLLGSNVMGLLKRELNSAQQRIKRLEAVTNDPHALWTNWLCGDVKLPEGIGDVRQYQERIQRLEEELMDTKNKHAVLVADVVLNEDRAERIKRMEEAGDYLCAAAAFMGWHDKIETWNKAKEAK